MSVFDHPEFDHHEAVHFIEDAASGLNCIIALHSTALGPAAGGCRRWQYANSTEALTDVLRLSRGMTYKNAVAGLPLGGGKAVILARDEAPKSRELFHAFGRAVHSLDGAYITAEDVGIAVGDMQVVREITPYVTGVSETSRLVGGDPSPWTALGVFNGMAASAQHAFGSSELKGLRVAIQGVGHVGYQLCKLLHEAGAELIVADVNRKNLRRITDEFGATAVGIESILGVDCDILSPCALGNVINQQSIPKIKARIIAGAANNQLGRDADGRLLRDAGILLAPDYVINAGGIIAVAKEYVGGATEQEVREDIDQISVRLSDIYARADESGESTNVIADRLAESIVSDAAKTDSRLIA